MKDKVYNFLIKRIKDFAVNLPLHTNKFKKNANRYIFVIISDILLWHVIQ